MSFENSPSLDDFKKGLPEKLPDPAPGKRNIRILLFCLLALALILSAESFLQSKAANFFMGNGEIKGIAVDAKGSPVSGNVFVIGVDQTVHTSPDGSFLLSHIPGGERELVVANAGTGWVYRVKVVAGHTVNVGQIKYTATTIPGQ
jgi:hypothetical protein